MRWIFASVAVVVAGAVVAFAIDTWGWRDPGAARQGKLAESDLNAVYYARGSCCHTTSLKRVGDHTWLAALRNSKGHRVCVIVDLWRFKPLGDRDFDGVTQTGCS